MLLFNILLGLVIFTALMKVGMFVLVISALVLTIAILRNS